MRRQTLYFTAPGEVELRETTLDGPAGDEVLVETRVSAISPGTERLVYRGEAPTDLPADETIDALSGDLSFPLSYGYAAVGDVVETGADVDDSWLGETVFAFNPHESTFAATPDQLVRVPSDLDAATAALLPTMETATNLVLDGHPRLGERVAVFGTGVVGLCTLTLLASFPLETLVAVDPVAPRREHARRVGADAAVDPDAVREELDGLGASGADLVYELSGRPETLDDAIAAAGYDSRVVVGSWYGQKRAPVDLGGRFHRDRISVESSQVSTLAPETRGRWTKDRRLDVALDSLRALDANALVTHRVPFEDAPEAYRLLDGDAESTLQILFTYQ